MYELNLDFSALYKQIQTGSEKDQYLISERGLQAPSIIGRHEVQKYNQTLAPPSRAKINYNRMRPVVSCLTAQEVTVVTSIEVGVGYRSNDPIYIRNQLKSIYKSVSWTMEN